MKHFAPQNGVYVYERYLNGKSVLVLMNGSSSDSEISLDRYSESLSGSASAKDFISGNYIAFGDQLTLKPRQIILVEI